MTAAATCLDAAAAARAGHRFSDLLPPGDWLKLPASTRRRFAGSFRAGRTRCYRGEVLAAKLTAPGWLLAQLARVIGAPLPLRDATGLATVVVTDHPGNRGQVWSRLYHQARGTPQTIHSIKRFSGPTGLEEYLGCGLSMPLVLRVSGQSLEFASHGFYLTLCGWRLRLPVWLTPGQLSVRHTEEGEGSFSFSLQLRHPRFGLLVYQHMRFRDDLPEHK